MILLSFKPCRLCLLTLLVAGIAFLPYYAHAQNTLGNVFNNMGQNISLVPQLIRAGSYMLGLIAIVVGLIKLKDSVDDPGKNKVQSGVIALMAGVLLIGLPIAIKLGASLSGANTAVAVTRPTMGQGFNGISR